MSSAGTYKGDAYKADWWPLKVSQPQYPVRGASGGIVKVLGDRRPNASVTKI